MLTMNTGLLPRSISSRTGYITTTTIQTKVLGHTIKEVQVIKTTSTDLPIPIKLPTSRSPSGSKTTRSLKSPLASPMISPRSFTSSKTFAFSPKSANPHLDQRQVFSIKRCSGHSPKQDIEDLVKNSLKQEKTQQRIQKIKSKQAIKLKLQKKLQMKVLDEFIRQENLSRFKQKCNLTRPKWGIDDKKVISDTKILREIEKVRKLHKPKKVFQDFAVFTNKKKKIKKFHKENEKIKHDVEEDLSTQKKKFAQKLKNLTNRVEKLRVETESVKDPRLEKLVKALEKPIKRNFFLRLSEVPLSQSSSSVSYMQEDNEVQSIMKMQKPLAEPEDHKSEINKSYEKLIETQEKLNKNQQDQLIDLKTRDMQEMNKLAEVLGDNPEIKKKFEGMIERRYSKLENLFKENMENIKQVLGIEELEENKDLDDKDLEDKNLEDMMPGLRNTISEFSSSFLMQLNEVPFAINVTFEDQPVEPAEPEDSFESPSEDSLYSRDTFPEPDPTAAEFPQANVPSKFHPVHDEPSLPLISESLVIDTQVRAQNPADSIEELVGGINSADRSDDMNSADNTLDLNAPAIPSQNHMYILEDSYGSGESGSNANFSSISYNSPPEPEIKEESHHSENRSLRIITEKFPSPFTDMYESSTEIEGYELIINRIIFTLEKDIFSQIYEELKNNDDYWLNIPKKPQIAIRLSIQDYENQVQTDSIAILSVFKRLQIIKNEDTIIQSVLKIYNPLSMLARVQDDYDQEDEIRIFDYTDIEKLDKSSSISLSISCSTSSPNPFKVTHNKVVIDAINEALCRSAKRKVNLPWKIQDQVFVLNFDSLMKSAAKKLVKWAEIEAGKIPTAEMLNSFGSLDEDKLQLARQEKLARFLIVDVSESDKSWIECDLEETQTALNLAEFVFDFLCMETVEFVA